MGMLGMSETERQILTNQAAIMGFLHGTFLDKISNQNSETYNGLFVFYKMTVDMLNADLKLKEGTYGLPQV